MYFEILYHIVFLQELVKEFVHVNVISFVFLVVFWKLSLPSLIYCNVGVSYKLIN